MTDSGRDTYATLKKYLFDYRDKFSKVPDLASTALQNADTTTKNYMGFVSGMVSLFSDTGISFMTSRTEVDLTDVDEKPTAIFLIIPDEIRTRYPLAILFVTQLYKRLVDKAQDRGGKLKRHVYFILDEFGNMPKFPEFGSSMAVGRSRGIYFMLCVQSYSQLYQNYGQDEGKIIKDNCPIQVYVASEDTTTNKEFSELLGKKTIVITNENKSTGPDGKDSKSTSTQVQSRPIAYPEELMTFRDEGYLAIKTFTPNAALKTKITPAYKAKCYDLTKVNGTYVARRMFDENAVYYDIKTRNTILADKAGDSDDDDDDDLF
jgi:type IV secretion system protein VirD4